jgi:hypothetical protein
VIKFLCDGIISDEKLIQCKNGIDLISLIQKEGLFSDNNVDYLINLLDIIPRKDLKSKFEKFLKVESPNLANSNVTANVTTQTEKIRTKHDTSPILVTTKTVSCQTTPPSETTPRQTKSLALKQKNSPLTSQAQLLSHLPLATIMEMCNILRCSGNGDVYKLLGAQYELNRGELVDLSRASYYGSSPEAKLFSTINMRFPNETINSFIKKCQSLGIMNISDCIMSKI